MNMLRVLFLALLLVAPGAFSMDEKDVPPPPMPEYMKKHQVDMDTHDTSLPAPDIETSRNDEVEEQEMEREVASEPAENFEGQSAEDIKNEFLQAGEEDEESPQEVEVAEQPEPAPAPEQPMEEIADQPTGTTVEDPVREIYQDAAGPNTEPAVQEVSEVEESSPEFEQAQMPDSVEPMGQAVENEQLAVVEEKLEEAEQVQEEIAAGARKPSAKKPFKSGMYKFDQECTMHKEPRSLSEEAGTIPVGRKLWIDGHDDNWLKAYKKDGTVYIPANCLQ